MYSPSIIGESAMAVDGKIWKKVRVWTGKIKKERKKEKKKKKREKK